MPSLKFNPRQIEAFRLVMLQGSVTLAAKSLFISQPAVSRLIRDLEASLGLTLFERRGNQLVPSPEATLLLAEIERTFVGLNAVERFATDLRERKTGALRIVALPAMAMGFIPRLVGRFMADRRLAPVHVHGMPSHMVVEAVATGQADIGLAVSPRDRPGLVIEPLIAETVVVMPAGHHLADRACIDVADLDGENFIKLVGDSTIEAQISARLQNIAVNIAVTTPLSGIACSLVAVGTGVAIVDPFSAIDFEGHGVVVKPLRQAPEIEIAVITSASRRLSRIGEAFMDLVRAETRRLSDSRRAPAGPVKRIQRKLKP